MIIEITLIFIFFLCWGSFLNVVGYRIIRDQDFLSARSHCPSCKTPLSWLDMIPVFSFLFFKGMCRYCNTPISRLYPAIELFTATSCTALFYYLPLYYFVQYAFYFSLLTISIRSDLEKMVISSFVTLYMIPVPLILSFFHLLPISFTDAAFGAISGYLCLWGIGKLFMWWTGKQGIGEGDFEILSLIGAWTGMLGCWCALTLGSCIGVIAGLIMQYYQKQEISTVKIPFVPCLALGSMLFVFFSRQLLLYLF